MQESATKSIKPVLLFGHFSRQLNEMPRRNSKVRGNSETVRAQPGDLMLEKSCEEMSGFFYKCVKGCFYADSASYYLRVNV